MAVSHLTMLRKLAIINVYKILNYCNSNEQINIFLRSLRYINIILISVTA